MEKKGLSGASNGDGKKSFWIELLKDIVFSLVVVALIAGFLFAYSGIWPPMVSIDGKSMLPNMKQGDLVIIRSLDKVNVVTYEEGQYNGYKMFNNYGDVIVYKPLGDKSNTPVIHRAMYWVDEGQPMWRGGPPAPHSGYITQGDNNFLYDQSSSISPGQPVKPEWILGVSEFRIPYLGLVRARLG
ncbi:S26 family signal peptidase [Methanocella sp. CWC-04]|uniref:S26 family signal peptidase n=1 Tax=Methanooceanicella nereidis TaxID=2052831 RepID=A0AAP2RDL0_9EURY|nr:S26 family signal peptidase [Methanocella sp. CWC-04]MCD1295314.1 S26 family signal peptidase [Methanocella sp. CWC-04]